MLFMEPMLINVISVVEKEGNFRARARAGLITRDIENAYLAFDPAEESPRARAFRCTQVWRRRPHKRRLILTIRR